MDNRFIAFAKETSHSSGFKATAKECEAWAQKHMQTNVSCTGAVLCQATAVIERTVPAIETTRLPDLEYTQEIPQAAVAKPPLFKSNGVGEANHDNL